MHIDILDKSKAEVKAHRRRPACAEKGKCNPHDGKQRQAHPNVEKSLRSDKTKKTKTNTGTAGIARLFCAIEHDNQKRKQQSNQEATTNKTELFSRNREKVSSATVRVMVLAVR